MRIALLPPDERPNTLGYAAWIGRCAGAEVLSPPPEAMPQFHRPGDTAALASWLRQVAPEVDHVVASLDLLVHGGLIPSRLTPDRIGEVLPRLDVLADLEVPITAYQVITRLPHYDNPGRSRQEPEYWITHGQRISEWSRRWHERRQGEADDAAVTAARAAVPSSYLQDLSQRRLRNHVVNLAALQLHAEGVIDTLIMSSDDTAPRGFPAVERQMLQEWNDRLGTDVPFYPGADEVPAVLVARVMAAQADVTPTIAIRCAEAGGLDRIAPYEDRPVIDTIRRQIRAAGARPVEGDADLVLAVHAPAVTPGDWVMDPPQEPDTAQVEATAALIESEVRAGKRVALADVRYANGSDPLLVSMLDEAGTLRELVAYGGWNTAGNTIGTTVAAAVSSVVDTSAEAAEQRRLFLANKIIKDGHYLPVVRSRVQEELAERGLTDPPLEEIDALAERITTELNAWAGTISALQGISVRNARLIWDYTFTVDFDLEVSD